MSGATLLPLRLAGLGIRFAGFNASLDLIAAIRMFFASLLHALVDVLLVLIAGLRECG